MMTTTKSHGKYQNVTEDPDATCIPELGSAAETLT
jgi:hypothetical protein